MRDGVLAAKAGVLQPQLELAVFLFAFFGCSGADKAGVALSSILVIASVAFAGRIAALRARVAEFVEPFARPAAFAAAQEFQAAHIAAATPSRRWRAGS